MFFVTTTTKTLWHCNYLHSNSATKSNVCGKNAQKRSLKNDTHGLIHDEARTEAPRAVHERVESHDGAPRAHGEGLDVREGEATRHAHAQEDCDHWL